MTERNPKQIGTKLWDCKPQVGLCPNKCPECFYNLKTKDGQYAFFVDPMKPHMPTPEEVGEGIVRVNSGHDSNIERDMVIAATEQYPHRFFNTSIYKQPEDLAFPAPVVLTANPQEEKKPHMPIGLCRGYPTGLMFVRFRTSPTNFFKPDFRDALHAWSYAGIPAVITFMRYYKTKPKVDKARQILGLDEEEPCYEYKEHIKNSYWCPTAAYMRAVMEHLREHNLRPNMLYMCGGFESAKCADCLNCETFYWQAYKRMKGE